MLLNLNNHYSHGFHNTFDYNHFIMTIYCTLWLLVLTLYANEYLKQIFEILLFSLKE